MANTSYAGSTAHLYCTRAWIYSVSDRPRVLVQETPAEATDFAVRVTRAVARVLKKALSDTWPIAASEGITKVLNLLLISLVARQLGPSGVGVMALGESLLLYGIAGTDMGAKLIGIRLAAKYPDQMHALIPAVQRKRRIFAVIALVVTAVWAEIATKGTRDVWAVLIYVAAVVPYAVSFDWAPWGRGQYRWLAAWRLVVGMSYVATAVLLLLAFAGGTRALAIGRFASYAAGLVLLYLWRAKSASPSRSDHGADRLDLDTELVWKSVLVLGIAMVANQLFQTVDVIMLAMFRTTEELGLYAAAYKVLFVLFSVFYLLTQTYLPAFSRLTASGSTKALREALLAVLAVALLAGVAVAIAVGFWSTDIIGFIYGSGLAPASRLLSMLAFAIPLEFVSAVLGTYLVASGSYQASLVTLGTGALASVAMNALVLPRYGAPGAAVITTLSYIVLLIAQVSAIAFRRRVSP